MGFSYMPGFGNDFETESAAGRAAAGPELAAAAGLWALCRATVRLALHRAARHQRALLALSHPAERQAHRALQGSELPLWKTRAQRRRPRAGARPIPLEPDADAEGADRLSSPASAP